jgi:ribose transport system substrate-binding protein
MRLFSGAAVVSTLAASALAFVGTGANPAGAAGKKFTVGFVVGAEADPFFQSMYVGASKEAKALGINLIWSGDPVDYSPATQLPIIQQVLAQKPNALVVAPTDTKALNSVMASAVKQGIPVFNVDSGSSVQSNITAWVTGNNVQGGQAAADALAAALKYKTACTKAHKCTVAVGVSSVTTSTDAARLLGFNQELKKKYPNITALNPVVSQSQPSVAQSGFSQDIAAHNLAGIFAIDGTDAEGAASAIAAAGSAGANIKVVGYDSYATNIANMQAGKLAAIVAQQPTLEGKLIIQYAYDRLVHKNAKGIPHLKTLPNILLTPQNCAKLCSTYVYTAS